MKLFLVLVTPVVAPILCILIVRALTQPMTPAERRSYARLTDDV